MFEEAQRNSRAWVGVAARVAKRRRPRATPSSLIPTSHSQPSRRQPVLNWLRCRRGDQLPSSTSRQSLKIVVTRFELDRPAAKTFLALPPQTFPIFMKFRLPSYCRAIRGNSKSTIKELTRAREGQRGKREKSNWTLSNGPVDQSWKRHCLVRTSKKRRKERKAIIVARRVFLSRAALKSFPRESSNTRLSLGGGSFFNSGHASPRFDGILRRGEFSSTSWSSVEGTCTNHRNERIIKELDIKIK